MDPPIFEPSGIVADERNLPGTVIPFRSGKQSETGQQLEAVANAEYKPPVFHELHKPVKQGSPVDSGVPYAIGTGLGRPQIVSIQETTRKDDYMVRREINFALGEKIQVNHINAVESGQFKRATRLQLAVYSVTRWDQGLDLHAR
jgi:hypothetical protein